MHSRAWESSFTPVGSWHIGGCGDSPAEVCGNGVELCSSSVVSWLGVKLPLTDSIKAAIPDTMGAEKLVPRLGLLMMSVV